MANEINKRDTGQTVVDGNSMITAESVRLLIKVIRGQQVIIDKDLALLYGIETRTLNQAVKRNIDRFPSDFMFQLTLEEFEDWKSQIVISNSANGLASSEMNSIVMGARKRPYAFTEQGVAMLSSVLRSKTAVEANIQIMRAFVAMRHFMLNNASVFSRLETMEYHQLEMKQEISETNRRMDEVFRRLDEGMTKPRQGVFYNGQVYDAYAFVSDLIKSARVKIVLIDNYVDESVLTLLDKRKNGVSATIYTQTVNRQLQLDIN